MNRTRANLIIFFLALTFASTTFAKKRYRYYLSASRAEQMLSDIVIHPRFSRDEWLSVVGPKKDDKYQVLRGENLWIIAKKIFGDPFLWRKLWQINQEISNPHEVEVGTLLDYYRDDMDPLPIVKLVPQNRGVASDLDSDIQVTQTLQARLRAPYVIIDENELLGELSGAYTERAGMTELDEIYLEFKDKSIARAGDLFTIAREETLAKGINVPKLSDGTIMRIVGTVKIIDPSDRLVRAEVVEAFHVIKRGDKILPLQTSLRQITPRAPPADLIALVVASEEPGHTMMGQGGILLLNKGSNEGMAEGFLFRVFQDTDTNKKTRDTVLPRSRGEVSIVHVGAHSSLGYIVRNVEPIRPGDVLVPYETLPSPPKRLHREAETIEIN
jgi:hypothetical protein